MSRSGSPDNQFVSLKGHTRVLTTVLSLVALLSLASVVVSLAHGAFADGVVAGMVHWARPGVAIAAFLAFCVWVHRAHTNLKTLGAKKLWFSPASAVAWLLVPRLNYRMAPLVMMEIWTVSDPEFDPEHTDYPDWPWMRSSPLIWLWWVSLYLALACLVASGTADGGIASIAPVSPTRVGVAGDVLAVISCISLMLVARATQARQSQSAASHNTTP